MTMCVRVSSASPRCGERQLTCAGHFAVERGDPSPRHSLREQTASLPQPIARSTEPKATTAVIVRWRGLRQPCSRARPRPSAGLSFPRVEHLSYLARQFGRRIRLLQESHSLGHAFLHDDIFCVTGDE
jgi:hypothetical protein